MALIPLPAGVVRSREEGVALTGRLYAEHLIEVPAVCWSEKGFIRISAQVYNSPADYERLASALPGMI